MASGPTPIYVNAVAELIDRIPLKSPESQWLAAQYFVLNLLAEARQEPGFSSGIEVPRGGVFGGFRGICKSARVGHEVGRSLLKKLDKMGEVTQEPTRLGTLITFVHFDTYVEPTAPTNTGTNTIPTHSQHTVNTQSTQPHARAGAPNIIGGTSSTTPSAVVVPDEAGNGTADYAAEVRDALPVSPDFDLPAVMAHYRAELAKKPGGALNSEIIVERILSRLHTAPAIKDQLGHQLTTADLTAIVTNWVQYGRPTRAAALFSPAPQWGDDPWWLVCLKSGKKSTKNPSAPVELESVRLRRELAEEKARATA